MSSEKTAQVNRTDGLTWNLAPRFPLDGSAEGGNAGQAVIGSTVAVRLMLLLAGWRWKMVSLLLLLAMAGQAQFLPAGALSARHSVSASGAAGIGQVVVVVAVVLFGCR